MSRPMQPFRKTSTDKKEAGDFRPRMGESPKKGERSPKGSPAVESAKSSRDGEISTAAKVENGSPKRKPRMGDPVVEIPLPESSIPSDSLNSDTSLGSPSPTPERPTTPGVVAEVPPNRTPPRPDFLLPATEDRAPGINLPKSPDSLPAKSETTATVEKEPLTPVETGTLPSSPNPKSGKPEQPA